MTRKTKLRLARLAAGIAWEAWYKRRDPEGCLPVLCYHRVLPDLVEDADEPLYTVSPGQFEAQLAWLAREGYHTLTLGEFADVARGRRALPRRAVMLTFDDGYADNYAVAWPLAQKHGLALNIFLSTGFLGGEGLLLFDKKGYRLAPEGQPPAEVPAPWRAHMQKYPHLWRPLTWSEVADLKAAGVGLGFHGHSHRDLGRLAPGEVKADLAAGLAFMQRHLGFRPEFFAPPYGGYASLPWAAMDALQGVGITFVFTTIFGRARLPLKGLLVPRLEILQQDDLDVFRQKLAGAYDGLGLIQRLTWLCRRSLAVFSGWRSSGSPGR